MKTVRTVQNQEQESWSMFLRSVNLKKMYKIFLFDYLGFYSKKKKMRSLDLDRSGKFLFFFLGFFKKP